MEPIVERCCGLDVHQATVVACMLVGGAHQKPTKEVRTFGTKTRELMELRDWLLTNGCTYVGMEATGIYWKPVHAVLEDDFEVVVGNAHHIKNVPGRKTDVKDSEWIADLLRHGLIAKSFVPPKPIRELRDLLRYRRKLVESRSAERNRLQKLLESANMTLIERESRRSARRARRLRQRPLGSTAVHLELTVVPARLPRHGTGHRDHAHRERRIVIRRSPFPIRAPVDRRVRT
ncbi:MAG TPA: IS110 family transposase [Polyangiaceae bacterium]